MMPESLFVGEIPAPVCKRCSQRGRRKGRLGVAWGFTADVRRLDKRWVQRYKNCWRGSMMSNLRLLQEGENNQVTYCMFKRARSDLMDWEFCVAQQPMITWLMANLF